MRVLLRPLARTDAEAFLSLVRESRVLHHPWVSPPADRRAFFRYVERSLSGELMALAACRREDGAMVGIFNLSQIFLGNFRSAYLGYFASAAHAGQGYMAEGLALTLRHAFRTVKLHRVEANIQPGNGRSRRLAKVAGFKLEGYSPRYLKVAGRWRDHERWALTVEDWRRGPTLRLHARRRGR